ncbi:upstream activation factor subunit spp27 homolog Non2 isoform X2 [Oratosquilla oratoria]|uniref:upstream activation factor subunit spp27 homolog Non2 isoform X2 n=1 Tax=Oratosquilla oratoria TaxID=337810 RepID=UPI003F76BBFD
MAQISRETLRKEVAAILKGADLNTLSSKKVRLQIGSKLGVDLSDRKDEIDQLIMADVEDQVNSHSEEEEEASEEEAPPPRRGKDESESEPEPEEKDEDDDYEPGAKKRKPKASPKKRKVDDDDDSDEEWGKRKKSNKGGGRRNKKSAFTKSFRLSPELADLVGADVMPRHEVVKKVWAVIKERNLQDPENKQFAICDDQLLKVIGVKRFRTFGMMKHLKDHFLEAA